MKNFSGKVYYSPGRNEIVEHILNDGLTWVYHQTQEEFLKRYPDAIVLTEDDAIARIDKNWEDYYSKRIKEVSEDYYLEQLDILPPVDYESSKRGTSFKMSEYTFANWTEILVSIKTNDTFFYKDKEGEWQMANKRRYFAFTGRDNLTHEEILDRIEKHLS